MGFDDSDKLADTPDKKRKQAEKHDIANKEKRIREILHNSEKGNLRGIIGGDVEHTEVISRLARRRIEIELINEVVSKHSNRYEEKEYYAGPHHFLYILSVTS